MLYPWVEKSNSEKDKQAGLISRRTQVKAANRGMEARRNFKQFLIY